MARHFLVTISSDIENLFAIKFISSFFHHLENDRVTLFHVCSRSTSDMQYSLNLMWENPESGVAEMIGSVARRAIGRAISLLHENGMAQEHVSVKAISERFGKVKDILLEGSAGYYDAVVLGRRAVYTLQWLFERPADEVSQSMIRDHSLAMPLWICPDIDHGRRNVLLCIDGSENSERAVEHVGYMVASEKQHKVTLLHVRGQKFDGQIFNRAVGQLKECGVDGQRIETRTVRGDKAAKIILSQVEKHKYAVVAVGLYGKRQSTASSEKLSGSTTAWLINKIEKSSLWCCA